jgi:hypothetical protein
MADEYKVRKSSPRGAARDRDIRLCHPLPRTRFSRDLSTIERHPKKSFVSGMRDLSSLRLRFPLFAPLSPAGSRAPAVTPA